MYSSSMEVEVKVSVIDNEQIQFSSQGSTHNGIVHHD